MRAALGMGTVILLAASLALTACGGDECDDANDKLTGECGLGSGAAFDGTTGECKGLTKCLAECVVDADCDEILEPDEDFEDIDDY
ncbi:MAG: hypothetical protein JRI23_13560, partial [Deltaproteobacteria bacterium]|nr:hypothetical protein [Deltaproteobacteria bacterium]MBW2532755.1 hypothetical protein [Deltaproteobacteria bacterium]